MRLANKQTLCGSLRLWAVPVVALAVMAIPAGMSAQALGGRRTLIIPGDTKDYYLTRVSGLVQTLDGTISVLDASERSVFRFAPSGKYLGRFGRRGEGPGELETPRILGLHGDSLWIWDMSNARVSVFGDDSVFRRSIRVPVTGQGLLLASGDLAIVPPLMYTVAGGPERETVIWRMSGGRLDTLTVVARPYRTLRYAVAGNMVVGRQPLDDGPLFSSSPNGRGFIYVDRGADLAQKHVFGVRVLDARANVVFDRRFSFRPRRVSSRQIDSAVDYLAQGPSDSPAGRAAIRKALYVPQYLPTVSQALLGADGTVWLRREDDGAATVRWTRISAKGDITGDVTLPSGFSPLFGRRDALLGTTLSADGVPQIERYEIR